MYSAITENSSRNSGLLCKTCSDLDVQSSTWACLVDRLESVLRCALCTETNCKNIAMDDGYAAWLQNVDRVRQESGTIYLIGNGASASMASHLAADLDKNGHVNTMVFTDAALLTALANDYSYEEVYSAPLRQRMTSRDMLVAISSSGKSQNILNACYVARRRNGFVVTLSAMTSDNPLRQLGDLNLYVPAGNYGLAESAHNAILHHWMDLVADQCLQNCPNR